MVGVVSLVPGVAPVPAAPDGDVVDGDVSSFVFGAVPPPVAPNGDVDGDVVDGVPSFVFGVVPPPVAPDGEVDVDGDVVPNLVFGITAPGPVVPPVAPLLASFPLAV